MTTQELLELQQGASRATSLAITKNESGKKIKYEAWLHALSLWTVLVKETDKQSEIGKTARRQAVIATYQAKGQKEARDFLAELMKGSNIHPQTFEELKTSLF